MMVLRPASSMTFRSLCHFPKQAPFLDIHYFKGKYFKYKQETLTLVICLQVLNICIAGWIPVLS